jgi:hypothetical protein
MREESNHLNISCELPEERLIPIATENFPPSFSIRLLMAPLGACKFAFSSIGFLVSSFLF